MQRDGAFVVQLAERDAQPPGVAEAIHGVVAQPADLADAHPGAGQQLDDQSAPPVRFDGQGGHELGGGGVVEELRQRLVRLRQVTGEHRDSSWRVGVVPVDDPLEEGAQHPEVVADGLGGHGAAVAAGTGGEGDLVGLDVATLDRSHRRAGRVGAGDVAGELAQHERGGRHRRRPGRHGELVQIGGHRRRHLRRPLSDHFPGGLR